MLYGIPPKGMEWTAAASDALRDLIPFDTLVTATVQVAAGDGEVALVDLATDEHPSINVIMRNNDTIWQK